MNLSLPAFLEIAIGLIFIYLILSLLASEIQELFAGYGQWRAKHLKKSIFLMFLGKGIVDEGKLEKLLQGEQLSPNTAPLENEQSQIIKLIDRLYSHYEISSLKQSSLGIRAKPRNQFGPSYIPPESFAEALIDVLAKDYNDSSVDLELVTKLAEENLELISQEDPETPTINPLPPYLTTNLSRLTKKALVKSRIGSEDIWVDPTPETISKAIEQLKTEIELWFQRSQDRTSGTYKRNSKIVLFFIGFIAAVLANADTFNIVENLHDENVREAVVTQATNVVATCKDKQGEELAACLEPNVKAALDLNRSPLGWSIFTEESKESNSSFFQKLIVYILGNSPGYIVTALATMMGAPLWFDLLKKFVNVRNAGPKPVLIDSDTPK